MNMPDEIYAGIEMRGINHRYYTEDCYWDTVCSTDMTRYIKADILGDKYVINRNKFIQIVDSVLAYHNEDKEFCDNFQKDVNELLKGAML